MVCKSIHDKYNEPKLYNIFPKSKHKVNFITENQYKFISHKHKHKLLLLPEIDTLDTLTKYEDLLQYNGFNTNYKFTYEMYKTFSHKDKDIFVNITPTKKKYETKLTLFFDNVIAPLQA